MAFCVCAMSLSTVSCGKLEDDINTLKGQVETLTIKLAELESKLNAEVASLNAAIAAVDAKVAVVKVEDKDGMVVLTLANGNTINVGKPDANANNTGLVTTVTKDGKTYWAVVKADGTVESLNVEVGHPDVKLSFKVNAETRELLISYDGTNYQSTGVVVKDPDSYKHIVTNFQEGEDYVTFTIGEKEYKLPKYEDAGSVLLGRTEMFVLPGVTKEITLASEGVTECYVMSKPDGWKAVLNEGILTVSAPSQAVIDFGACETEGLVLVHATTAAGKCVVAPLNVKTGPAITFSLDSNGNVTIFNALTIVATRWGEEYTDFAYIEFGISTVEEYVAFETPEAFFENAASEELGYGLTNLLNNLDNELNPWYEEGYNEEYTVTANINDLASCFAPAMTLDPEKSYVVWMFPRGNQNRPMYEYAAAAFTKPYVTKAASNETYNDADIELNLNGADAFYVGAVSQKYLTNEQWPSLDEYLMGMEWMPGPWAKFTQGNPAALGTKYVSGTYSIKLSEITEVEPNCEYYVWAVPYNKDKAAADYDYEADFMPYMFTVETAARTLNESLVATITEIIDNPYKVGATVTPPAGASVYTYLFSEEMYEMASENDMVMNYVESEDPAKNSRKVAEDYDVTPGNKFYLVTFVVKDGEEGPVQVKELVASDLPYATDINVEFVSLTEDAEAATYTVTFNVTGGAKFAGYNISYPGSEWSPSLPTFEKNVYTLSNYYLNSYYQTADVAEDGVVTMTFAKNANKTHYFATAYNVTNGEMAGMAKTVVVDLATGTVVDTTATEEEEEELQ